MKADVKAIVDNKNSICSVTKKLKLENDTKGIRIGVSKQCTIQIVDANALILDKYVFIFPITHPHSS